MRSNPSSLTKFHRTPAFFALLTTFIALIMIGVLVVQAASSPAGDSPAVRRVKYFESITVHPGDSLWSIANRYRTEEYDSVRAYIREVCEMNDITDNRIYAGRHLLIAYYCDVPVAEEISDRR